MSFAIECFHRMCFPKAYISPFFKGRKQNFPFIFFYKEQKENRP